MKLKKLCIITMLIITILFSATTVFAQSIDTQVSANKTEVKALEEEEVILNLRLNNFKEIEKGLYAYKAEIDYNKEIFKELDESDFECKNSWTSLKYNKQNNQFVIIKKVGTKQEEDIIQIKLKVKKDAKSGNTNIIIKDQTTSEGKNDIEIQDSNVNIKVIQEEENNNSGTGNQGESGNNNQNNTGNNNQSNNEQNLGMADTPIPNAGIGNFRSIIFIIGEILLIIAIYSFIKYKKIDKKINAKNKKILGIFLAIILMTQLTKSVYATIIDFSKKGEINDDGEVNYADVELIEMHLINLKKLPDEKLENADMNSDGKITVTDLTILVQKIENKLNFEAEVSASQLDNYYPSKNQEIELRFYVSVNYGGIVKKVIINGQEYETEQIGNTSEYKTKIKVKDTSGIQDLKFSKVILDNEKEIKVKYTEKVDILKDKPTVENYQIEENIQEHKANISFDIKDMDKAFQNGYYQITDENTNIIKEEELKSGKNEIELDFEEGKKYVLNIYGGYDLDTNELNNITGDKNKVESENLFTKPIQILVNYDLKITDIKTEKADGVYSKKEPITILFKSSNIPNIDVEKVVINSKEYNVIKSGDYYKVQIQAEEKEGKKEYKIERVILSNGKELEPSLENKVIVEIVKNNPEITEFKTLEDVQNRKIKINFNVKDIDNTFEKGTIILQDENKNDIERKEFTQKENEIEFNTKSTSKYFVKILADYNIEPDGIGHEIHKYKNKEIFNQEIVAEYKIEVNNFNVNKYYPNKEEQIIVSYEFTTNRQADIKKIQVNSVIYNATKTKDGKYEIKIKMPSNSGIVNLELEKVILNDGTEIVQNYIGKVDVLKEKPSIENYNINDDLENSKIIANFEVKDEENSFINGKLQMIKEANNKEQVISEQEIKKGQNNIELSVEEGQTYKLKIMTTYDKDTNTLPNKPESDNRVIDEVLLQKEVILIGNYDLKITDLKTYKQNIESKYFSKGEKIKVKFRSSNKTKYVPTRVTVNGQNYNVTKEGELYVIEINGYSESGIKNIIIEKVQLSNGKEVSVEKENTAKIDILKEIPNIEQYKYVETDDGKYIVTFNLVDSENAITKNKKVIITDENKKELVNQEIKVGNNEFTFTKTTSEKYYIKVLVDYDLDTNTIDGIANEYNNQTILSEEIDSSDRLIEMKDIMSIELFRQNGNQVEEVNEINLDSNLNFEQYLVKVNMKDLPSLYAKIKEHKIENGSLKFILDYDKTVQYYGEEKQNKLEVTYGEIKNNIATINNINSLVKMMKENPSGSYELVNDIDVKQLDAGTVLFIEQFSGTLNGNGHIIKNLDRPLFNNLNGARIENIVIENAKLSGQGARGSIANDAINTTLVNLHIKGLTMQTARNESGSMIGTLRSGSIIEQCSATNIQISGGNKRTGGLAGAMGNATVRNSYVQGIFNCTQDAIGGIAGSGENNSKIENSISKVEFKVTSGPGYNGGIIGHSMNVVLKNNVSLSTGSKANKIYGTQINGNSTNNYELKESTLEPNLGNNGTKEIEQSKVNKEFFKNNVKLDENIWDLENTSYDNIPALKNSDPNLSENKQNKPENEDIYIPDYARLRKLSNYDKNREIAYSNMYKLMPFYDAKYLITDGNKIDLNNELNTKIIKSIIPFTKQNTDITGLTNNTKQEISKIKILFEDDTIKEYSVNYKDTINNIANYEIVDLKIGYNYNKYLLIENSKVITNLINKIKNYTFENNLNSITTENESRIYKENFDNVVKENAKSFVINLLTNMQEYNISIDSSILENKVMTELTEDQELEKILVAYNYFDRFYNIQIGGINVRDYVFFDDSILKSGINPKIITNKFLNAPQGQRMTSSTVDFYNNQLKVYTKIEDIGTFIEYFITTFGGYKDPTRWIVDNFDGILCEAAAQNYGEQIEYRVWSLMKKRPILILPVLTAPSKDMFIVSVPTSIAVGSINAYLPKSANDEKRAEFKTRLEDYAKQLGTFYNTAAGFINNSVTLMNKYTSIQWDNRYISGVLQEEGKTEDPVFKHIYEVTGYWPATNGSGAYANGVDVYWVVNKFVGDVATFTHEMAHNQDGKIFFEGEGRRRNAGGECFTDSVIAQSFPDSSMHYNLIYNFSYTNEVSNNLTPDRIDTKEKLADYYEKMWETINLLDYIEAQAFLQMSPEVQSKVAKQYYAPNGENTYIDTEEQTAWRQLSAEEFKKLNLKTVEDLWDNRINIKVKQNMNNGDSMDNVYWYQPHNDKGFIHFIMFKRLAFEMLSVGGYTNGMVAYISGKYANDLEALRAITNDSSMTWKKYQMNKYDTVKEKMNNNSYFDTQKLIEMFKKTMETDAKIDVDYVVPPDKEGYRPSDTTNNNEGTKTTNLRRILFHYMQRATEDFKTGIYDPKEITHIANSTDFIQKIKENPHGKFVLDADINLSGITGKTSITDVDFVGEINGNGHTITGIQMPIFNLVKYSNIYDLKIDNVNINSTSNEIGVLSKSLSYSLLKNVHIVSGKISGNDKVGGIAGYLNQSNIKECTVNINVNATGNRIGNFAGELDNSMVQDSYTLGNVVGRQDVGGFAGYAENTSIENCFSAVKVEAKSSGSGGFIGRSAIGSNVIKVRLANNVSFGDTINAYKFDGRSDSERIKKYENNYEYEESLGLSTLERTGIDFSNKISVVSTDTIKTNKFYLETLKWDSNIWDFSNVEKGFLPKLKNLDPNTNAIAVVKKEKINSIEDFKKINSAPDKIYTLESDIDASSVTEGTTIVSAKFTGKLEGNGHTISNLDRPLFNTINSATIKDIKLKEVTLKDGNEKGAIANDATNSKISNIHLEGLTMQTTSNESGGLIGVLKAGSVIEQCSAININITGGNTRTGGLVGAMGNGTIRDSYTTGTINCRSNGVGGISGHAESNSRIENCISNVELNMTSSQNDNGGIVGISSNVILLNNLSLVTGKNAFRIYGANIRTESRNNYELEDSTLSTNKTEGISNEMVKTVTQVQLRNKDFYKNTLGLKDTIWDFTGVENGKLPTLKKQ